MFCVLSRSLSNFIFDIRKLRETIEEFDPSLIVPFPPFEGSRFRELLDEEMGFV